MAVAAADRRLRARGHFKGYVGNEGYWELQEDHKHFDKATGGYLYFNRLGI